KHRGNDTDEFDDDDHEELLRQKQPNATSPNITNANPANASKPDELNKPLNVSSRALNITSPNATAPNVTKPANASKDDDDDYDDIDKPLNATSPNVTQNNTAANETKPSNKTKDDDDDEDDDIKPIDLLAKKPNVTSSTPKATNKTKDDDDDYDDEDKKAGNATAANKTAPGFNATAPNTTHNLTAPNTTHPNVTALNTTHNATAPNATHPVNVTKARDVDDDEIHTPKNATTTVPPETSPNITTPSAPADLSNLTLILNPILKKNNIRPKTGRLESVEEYPGQTYIESHLINRNLSAQYDDELKLDRVYEPDYLKELNTTVKLNESQIHNGSKSDVGLMKRAINASNKFSIVLFNIMNKLMPNVIFSPLSIVMIFTILLRGANGMTAKEIYNVLGFDKAGFKNINEIQDACHALIHFFDTRYNDVGDEIRLEFANGLWLREGEKVNTLFLNDIEKYFHATANGISYSKGPSHSQKQLSNWVLNKTNDRIMSCEVRNEPIDPLSKLTAMTTIYFGAQWDVPFKANLGTQKDFYNLGKLPISTQFIQVTTDLPLYRSKSLEADLVEVPFKTSSNQVKYTIVFVKPKTGVKLAAVEKKLQDFDTLFQVTKKLKETRVSLTIPKFVAEQSSRLDRLMPYVGVQNLFHPHTCELPFITVFDRIFANRIYHESFLEFKSNGTEEEAVVIKDFEPQQNFHRSIKTGISDYVLDNPFLYFVLEKVTETLIYVGRVSIV
ncbi:serpin B4-like protein, partial [Leptotrombidium deliense]